MEPSPGAKLDEELKAELSNILLDNRYFCKTTFFKTEQLLEHLASPQCTDTNGAIIKVNTLLDKMRLNIADFVQRFGSSVEQHRKKNDRQPTPASPPKANGVIPRSEGPQTPEKPPIVTTPVKNKLSLSLKKSSDKSDTSGSIKDNNNDKNSSSSDSDIVLVSSITGVPKSSPPKQTPAKSVTSPSKSEEVSQVVSSGDSSSDTEDERHVPLSYFDAPEENVEEHQKELEKLEKMQNNEGSGTSAPTFTTVTVEETNKDQAMLKDESFDFDSTNDLEASPSVAPGLLADIKAEEDPVLNQQKTENEQQDIKDRNLELLLLLKQITEDNSVREEDVTMEIQKEVPDEEVTEALKRLIDDENSDSNDGDSDSDGDSDISQLLKGCGSGSEFEEPSDADDERERSENEMDEVEMRGVQIRMSRLDELNDAEIDRLCDLNNINRKKCHSLKKIRNITTKKKSIRLISSTSSSSSMSLDDSQATPDDLITDDTPCGQGDNVSTDNLDNENAQNLIDLLTNYKATDNDTSDSSDNQGDQDKPKSPKEVVEVVKSDGDVEMIEEDTTKRESDTDKKEEGDQKDLDSNPKKRKIDDPLLKRLWSSSSSSGRNNGDSTTTDDANSDDCAEKKTRKRAKKRRNVELVPPPFDISSDSAAESEESQITVNSSDSYGSDLEFVSHTAAPSKDGRKNLKSIKNDYDLTQATQEAKRTEEARIKRLEEHSRSLSLALSQHDEFILDCDPRTGDPLITVTRALFNRLKPHQKEGIQFMWNACYESVDMLKRGPGTGCILAHCMGLGKTFQVIALIHTLFAHPVTKTKQVLVVCPLSTVLNWQNEFKIAFDLLGKREFKVTAIVTQKDKVQIIKDWYRRGGVLLLSYDQFITCTKDLKVNPDKKPKPKAFYSSEAMQLRHAADRAELKKALVDPGPDLVVCDEGHILKSGKTQRTKCLSKIKTKRRIVLTGTPLQNNLKEYYYMVEFVKKNILGTFEEYSNRFLEPIMNGQYYNSTDHDIKLMKKRTHVLNKLLKLTIHRVESKELKQYLPEILDYTLFICMHPIQIQIYSKYIDKARTREKNKQSGFFSDFIMTKYINLHPYVVEQSYIEGQSKKKKKEQETIDDDDADVVMLPEIINEQDWYREHLPPDFQDNIDYGTKLKVLMAIIEKATLNNEKVLVFSNSLVMLSCIEHFFKRSTSTVPPWIEGKDYIRMDGHVPPVKRSEMCDEFNDETNTRLKVFLISHRVGGLGLNLTAATRVILMESNFNPCHDTQSIYRAYRFGQTKRCYVYRLLSVGTIEEKIYRKCVIKLAVASTVVDKMHVARHYRSVDLQEMYHYDFAQFEVPRPLSSVPADKLLADLYQSYECIHSFLEHNALLENLPEEELNDEEKKLAWDEYHNEERLRTVALNAAAAAVVVPPSVSGRPNNNLSTGAAGVPMSNSSSFDNFVATLATSTARAPIYRPAVPTTAKPPLPWLQAGPSQATYNNTSLRPGFVLTRLKKPLTKPFTSFCGNNSAPATGGPPTLRPRGVSPPVYGDPRLRFPSPRLAIPPMRLPQPRLATPQMRINPARLASPAQPPGILNSGPRAVATTNYRPQFTTTSNSVASDSNNITIFRNLDNSYSYRPNDENPDDPQFQGEFNYALNRAQ